MGDCDNDSAALDFLRSEHKRILSGLHAQIRELQTRNAELMLETSLARCDELRELNEREKDATIAMLGQQVAELTARCSELEDALEARTASAAHAANAANGHHAPEQEKSNCSEGDQDAAAHSNTQRQQHHSEVTSPHTPHAPRPPPPRRPSESGSSPSSGGSGRLRIRRRLVQPSPPAAGASQADGAAVADGGLCSCACSGPHRPARSPGSRRLPVPPPPPGTGAQPTTNPPPRPFLNEAQAALHRELCLAQAHALSDDPHCSCSSLVTTRVIPPIATARAIQGAVARMRQNAALVTPAPFRAVQDQQAPPPAPAAHRLSS
eukprot:m.303277 g.303277  ORF g.303277 m.303277 type:complete len:322 (-) comp15794_c0_seq1:106-1071(-)